MLNNDRSVLILASVLWSKLNEIHVSTMSDPGEGLPKTPFGQ